MAPIFVSYFAHWKGEHHGWLVFPNIGPIETGADVEHLAKRVETEREWPAGTVVIRSFQRLENTAALPTG